jgi:hypothetical protein
MSSYKDLTNSPAFNFTGENKWDIKTPSENWSILDGSVLLQSSHEKLFQKFGFVQDNPTGTTVTIDPTVSGISANVNSVIYANNIFVYAGESGALVTTPNTVTWTTQTSGTSNNINVLLYANNTFVYAGAGGVLATSPDATTWTQRTSGTSSNINALAYGNNTFVYAGDTGVIASSSNAVTWTTRTSGTSSNINALTYANNTFVYAGDAAALATSTDGVTWSRKLAYQNITYVGGKVAGRLGNNTPAIVSITDLTGGIASAPAEDDVIILVVATGNSGTTNLEGPGDFNQIASLFANDDIGTNLWVGYKYVGSTPDTTVTIPASGTTLAAQTYAIQVWRNVAGQSWNLFDGSATSSLTFNSARANPAAITTTTANNVLLVIGAGAHERGANTYTASYLSNFLTVGSNDTYDSTIGFGSINQESPITYDPPAFTFDATDSTQYSAAAVTIALQPQIVDITTLTYGSNTFVYAGEHTGGLGPRVVATSSNASNWSPDYLNISLSGGSITELNYSGVEFALTSNNDGIWATSPDAITWTQRTVSDISYQGGKTFARAGNTLPEIISITDLAGGRASAPEDGDIVVIAVASGSNTSRSQAVTGFTTIRSLYVSDSYDTNLWVGYKVMGSAPDTTVTIPASGSTDDAQTVAIQVWRNAQFSSSANTTSSAGAAAANPPSRSGNVNDIIIAVVAGGHDAGEQTYNSPDLGNFLTIGSSGTFDSTIGMGSGVMTGTSFDPAAFGFSGTDSSFYTSAAVTIAFTPKLNFTALTSQNTTYYYGGSYGNLGVLGFTSYDTLTEFALPVATLQIANGLPNNTYVKL